MQTEHSPKVYVNLNLFLAGAVHDLIEYFI